MNMFSEMWRFLPQIPSGKCHFCSKPTNIKNNDTGGGWLPTDGHLCIGGKRENTRSGDWRSLSRGIKRLTCIAPATITVPATGATLPLPIDRSLRRRLGYCCGRIDLFEEHMILTKILNSTKKIACLFEQLFFCIVFLVFFSPRSPIGRNPPPRPTRASPRAACRF